MLLTCSSDLADIRRENILKALPPIPGAPPRCAPFHGQEHEWRLVDFELGIKMNIMPLPSAQFWMPKCGRVLMDIEDGDCEE